jgi:hypothetical protein
MIISKAQRITRTRLARMGYRRFNFLLITVDILRAIDRLNRRAILRSTALK